MEKSKWGESKGLRGAEYVTSFAHLTRLCSEKAPCMQRATKGPIKELHDPYPRGVSSPSTDSTLIVAMSVQTLAITVVAVVYFVIRYLNRTDVPKIKGLPEIPGVPLFGNLLQLGNSHAVVAGKWAKKFGPVFQVRMGNRVGRGHQLAGEMRN